MEGSDKSKEPMLEEHSTYGIVMFTTLKHAEGARAVTAPEGDGVMHGIHAGQLMYVG